MNKLEITFGFLLKSIYLNVLHDENILMDFKFCCPFSVEDSNSKWFIVEVIKIK